VNGKTYYTDIISKQTYGNGDYIRFIYNDEDQLIAIKFKDEEEARFEYMYGEDGKVAIYKDNYNEIEYLYKYDDYGRLIEVVDNQGNLIVYEYDNKDNFVNI